MIRSRWWFFFFLGFSFLVLLPNFVTYSKFDFEVKAATLILFLCNKKARPIAVLLDPLKIRTFKQMINKLQKVSFCLGKYSSS